MEGQSGLTFLREIRIFNPKNILFMSPDISEPTAISEFVDLPQHELTRYDEKLEPSAVRDSVIRNMDMIGF